MVGQGVGGRTGGVHAAGAAAADAGGRAGRPAGGRRVPDRRRCSAARLRHRRGLRPAGCPPQRGGPGGGRGTRRGDRRARPARSVRCRARDRRGQPGGSRTARLRGDGSPSRVVARSGRPGPDSGPGERRPGRDCRVRPAADARRRQGCRLATALRHHDLDLARRAGRRRQPGGHPLLGVPRVPDRLLLRAHRLEGRGARRDDGGHGPDQGPRPEHLLHRGAARGERSRRRHGPEGPARAADAGSRAPRDLHPEHGRERSDPGGQRPARVHRRAGLLQRGPAGRGRAAAPDPGARPPGVRGHTRQ